MGPLQGVLCFNNTITSSIDDYKNKLIIIISILRANMRYEYEARHTAGLWTFRSSCVLEGALTLLMFALWNEHWQLAELSDIFRDYYWLIDMGGSRSQ